MRGRYEKPKQKRFGKNTQDTTGYSRPNPDYPRGGYPDNQYSYENGYDGGYQGGYNNYPPQGGYPGYPGNLQPPRKEKGCFGWGLLGFLIPLVGLILFLVWKNKKPRSSKAAGIGALTGFIAGILALVLAFVGMHSFLDDMLGSMNQVDVNVSYTEEATEAIETEATVPTETEVVETTEPPHVASREDYINFLVVGQSSRGEGDAEQARFADSMMLITLNTYEKTLTMTSLLRDTFVQPPNFRGHDFGRIKLTTVYHLGSFYDNGNIAGSMEFIDLTLFKNFGVEVDHNFEVDFNIFTDVIDLLGGITLEMDEAEAKYMNDEVATMWGGEVYGPYEAGETYLDGVPALAYARMRHADGDGDSDIKRTARQQKVVTAIMNKVRTKSLPELQALVKEVLPMVSTSMTSSEITKMMVDLLPMLPQLKVQSGGTCPANYHGELVDIYKDGMMHSILRFDERETKEHMRELTLGELPASGKSTLTKEAPAKTGTAPASAPTQASEPAPTQAPAPTTAPTQAPAPTAAPAESSAPAATEAAAG